MMTYSIPVASEPRPLRNGHVQGGALSRRALDGAPGSWRTPWLLTAALLVLLLGAGYFGYRAFGIGEPERRSIPAVVLSDATPTPDGAGGQGRLEVVLPAEMFPHGDKVVGTLHDVEIPAGSTTTWTIDDVTCCVGIRIDYVRTGGIGVRVDGPAQLVRAGSRAMEQVAGGADVTLGVGDTLLYPNRTAATYTNAAADPVALLTWVLFDERTGGYGAAPLPAGWTMTRTTLRFEQTIPEGPATLRLERIELPGREELSPPAGVLQFGVITSEFVGDASTPRDVGHLDDGSVRNFGAGPVIVYVMTLTPENPPAATPEPYDMSNAADDFGT